MREIVVKSCILFLSQEAALLEIILSICICTVVWRKENAKPTLQEGVLLSEEPGRANVQFDANTYYSSLPKSTTIQRLRLEICNLCL
jgi:hypothetical protein